METTEYIWQNGKFIPWSDAKVHILSHGLHYGGSAFEGIRFYKTEQGSAIFRLQDHLDRLAFSAKAVGMTMPYSKAEITQTIFELIQKNRIEEGYIRPIVYYGFTKMGVNPIGNPIEMAIACWPWKVYLSHDSVSIQTSPYIRIHPNSTIIEAKLSGHYVNGILASIALEGSDAHESLFLDEDDHIAEGVGENFFMVKEGVIYTPKPGTILSGITRQTIMRLCKTMGYDVIEADLRLYDAYQADETFFTGTAAEVTAIGRINQKTIGNGKIGAITSQIKTAYMDVVRGRNPNFMDYLTFIS